MKDGFGQKEYCVSPLYDRTMLVRKLEIARHQVAVIFGLPAFKPAPKAVLAINMATNAVTAKTAFLVFPLL